MSFSSKNKGWILGSQRPFVQSLYMQFEHHTRNLATRLLNEFSASDMANPIEFSSMLYDEMRQLAKQMMHDERDNHTLQPTALVHEAFIRLINADGLDINSKDHFFMLASKVMRRILIDHARSTNRLKRGGNWHQVPLTVVNPESKSPMDPSEILALDEALDRLKSLDERKARVVELRFFGGLDEETSARILGIARSTASSDWRFARAWLMDQLKDENGPRTNE